MSAPPPRPRAASLWAKGTDGAALPELGLILGLLSLGLLAAFLVAAALIEAYWSELGSKAGVLAPMLTLSVVLGLVGVVVNAVAVKRGRTPRRRAWLGLVASAVSPLSVGVVSLFLWWLFSQDWSFQ